MSLIVLEPGIESRIVDAGRPRTRSLGVPVGGASDRRSLALGNALVGNPPDAAALEVTLKGPVLRTDAKLGCVIIGAQYEIFSRTGWPFAKPGGWTWTVPVGEELSFGAAKLGVRAYLCVRGGFHVPSILGSRSALEPIKKGDVLRCEVSGIHSRYCPELQLTPLQPESISTVPGLQVSWFDEREFFDQTFTVAPASNRMGIRLKGIPLTMPKREMVSEAVCPGAIQVTNEGQCIVLGVDGQTIGGYPKIAQVIQADLDKLGQLRPGQAIQFKQVTLEEAVQREREAQKNLREWTLRLRLSLDAFPAARRFASS